VLLAFRLRPHGFRHRDLRGLLTDLLGKPEITTGKMSYYLRRLRAHGLITRIPRTHRYRVINTGLHHTGESVVRHVPCRCASARALAPH
jgi:hypothetical protein